MVYMYHSFLVHSSADGHLGCFHVLAMTNSAAMGKTCKLKDVSFQCMTKFTTKKKKENTMIKFPEIKKKKKKKES